MAGKYKFDPDAYKKRVARLKARPELKERFKVYEKNLEGHPTFDTEKEALKFALEKTKSGENWTIWQAPKELGGKWKAISWDAGNGMGPDSADQLGWSIIYDTEQLQAKSTIDEIDEV